MTIFSTDFILSELERCGTTVPLFDENGKETAPAIFKTGIGIDTESTTITHREKTKTVVDACFCYCCQIAINDVPFIFRYNSEFTSAFKMICEAVKIYNALYSTNARLIIWCANLSHEWSFLKYDLLNTLQCTRCFARTQREPLFIEFGNVVLRECIGLFGHSLADIAKNWTKTQKLKGDLDYDLIRTPETPLTAQEIAYCENDVLILSEMHRAVIAEYTQPNGVCILPYTSSGFVRMKLKNAIRENEYLTESRNAANFYRKNKPFKTNIELIQNQNRKLYISPTQWYLCREYGYSGGLCGSNIKYVGKQLKNVQCVDLTSDYPAQMLHCKFPSGRLREYSPREFDNIKNSGRPFFLLMRIKSMVSKNGHSTFSHHKIINTKEPEFIECYGEPRNLIIHNGKVLKCENAIIIMNDVDLAAYKQIYRIKFDVLTIWAFDLYKKLPDWLRDSIIDDYVKKAVLKREHKQDTVEYKDAKRNVNTYYGVLAQRSTDINNQFDEETGLFTPEKALSFGDIKNKSWLNPYWAFYITSYARKILMDFISQFGDSIVQYDTDSLYYIKNKSESLENTVNTYNEKQYHINDVIFRNNPNKDLLRDLGAFDFENCYVNFLPLGAKKYIKQNQSGDIETVIAGLPKKAIPSEIAAKHINKPFTHYNVLREFLENDNSMIIIKHVFADKFASVYDDTPTKRNIEVIDYLGNKSLVEVGSYHAIIPIDFTLSLSMQYIHAILQHG